jgi:hypothetical protein
MGGVGCDLFRAARADQGGRHRRVTQGEPQCCRGQRYAVPGAGIPEPAGPGQQGGRRRGIVVACAVTGIGQDAAVEHAARQHGDAAPLAQREQAGRRRVVEQRVAAGHQHAVQVAALDEPGQRRRRVHAGADGADRALGAEFGQRGVRLVRRLLHEVVGVVDEYDVHPVEPEPFQAFLQAAPHSVPAVVADPGQRRYVVKSLLALDVPGGGHQPPAHLGAHGELVPGAPGQERAEPPLGHADAIMRRRVEGPDPRFPGRGHRPGRRLVADRRVEPADGRPAKYQGAGDEGAGFAWAGVNGHDIPPARHAGPDG